MPLIEKETMGVPRRRQVPDTRVGILGGGQLARMLAEAAHRLGLIPVIFTEDVDSPAARVAPQVVKGRLSDMQALKRFLDAIECAAFENEFVDCDALEAAAPKGKKLFHPDLAVMRELQDKARQKACFLRLGLATSPYELYPGADAEPWLKSLLTKFAEGFVLKWAMFGYDGKGLCFVNSVKDFPRAKSFIETGKNRKVAVYAEKAVRFDRELAIVACRSLSGEFKSYPLVLSDQKNGICLEVKGPAALLGVPAPLEAKVKQWAKTLADSLDLVGTFALECFLTGDEILVNEVAPRVHNSGHYTMDAARTSQFENHWRALLGWPLGSVHTHPAFVMYNLLGPEGLSCAGPELPLPVPPNEVHLHWYGKSAIRPGRKLGHLNAATFEPQELNSLVEKCRATAAQWEKGMN